MGVEILCIGSVLWDVIGRADCDMRQRSDVPGRITRVPGGVALNIAMTCARFGLRPVLLSAVGQDASGDALLTQCSALGLNTQHVHRMADHPTDRYMAIEGTNGVMAAIADARTLEAAGDAILTPLFDGSIQSAGGAGCLAALDGNLTAPLLRSIAEDARFDRVDLRIAPASPGKAARLLPFVRAGRGVLYVNLEEAGILCGTSFEGSEAAACALVARGAARAIVTNGEGAAADATADAMANTTGDAVITAQPPRAEVVRRTGAGDTFMAAHIAAERRAKGQCADRAEALQQALAAAGAFVAGHDP